MGNHSDLPRLNHLENYNNLSDKDEIIEYYSSPSVLDFIRKYCTIYFENTEIIHTTNLLSVKKICNEHDSIINLHKINDIRYVNKFFEEINEKLPLGGKFVCCVETFSARKKRKSIGKIPFIGNIYFFIEFIFLRVFPKIKYLKKIYFKLTRGKNRLMSKTESLGRLISCGFDLLDYKEINGILYIVCIKKRKPKFDMTPSYGPIYKMPRVGKNKKIINVYKLRTMHPYSEYLQSYIFEKNGTKNGDKIINDFRVSKQGMFFRKYWIDELPMLINLFRGDIKIVGVRPLSISKFKIYPKYAQDARVKTKPGLIPPFYVDLPKTFDELINSEMTYIEKYKKSPFFTDVVYFFKALYNIFIKKARSS